MIKQTFFKNYYTVSIAEYKRLVKEIYLIKSKYKNLKGGISNDYNKRIF